MLVSSHRHAIAPLRLLMLLVVGLVGVLLAGCTSGSPSAASPQGEETSAAAAPAKIAINPAAGAVDVSPTAPITVTASDGKLGEVSMLNPEGVPVAGELNPEGTVWTAMEPLGYGKAYTINATATGANGKPVTSNADFSTVAPQATTYPSMNPLDGQTVGAGQPLAIYFDEDIENKQAAEDAIEITTNPPVEGAFYWFSDSEVHYRPKDFWAPGTTIDMNIAVYGKDLGAGVYGQENRRATITIGDSMIARADAASHQMSVEINGEVVRTMPISMGSPEFPSNNGVHVVSEQHDSYEMDSSTYGLSPDEGGYVTTVQYATRISNGGEFVHAAPWSVGDQGSTNVSHGCINLSTENAKWFFDTAKKGDVVIQSNTGGDDLEPYDGFGDWQIPWEQWQAGGEA